MKLYSRILVYSALAVVLCGSAWALAFSATEHEATTEYCEGCDNGVVELTMDGGSARTENLKDAGAGHYTGTGYLHYQAQGLDIRDDAAVFDVTLVPSPTGKVTTPTNCTRASQLASSIRVTGGKGASAYELTTDEFHVWVDRPCAYSTFTVTITQHAKANGLSKHKGITVAGRTKLKP